jgi:non-ribosomal peptide synthase protein (TIGR01720 family)
MEFVCLVSGGRLGVGLGFDQGRYRRESLEGLLGTFRSALLDIIAYCSEKETTEPTSSDFTYKGLSVEAMDNLFDAESP